MARGASSAGPELGCHTIGIVTSDRQLVEACLRRDASAREELTDRCRPLVLGLAIGRFRLAECDAEDLFQSLVVRLFERDARALRAWRREGKLTTYLTVIVSRMCLEKIRGRNRDAPLEDVEETQLAESSATPDAESVIDRDSRRRAVRDCWRELSARDRLLLTLRYRDELPPREIAPVLGLKRVTVRKALFDARRRIEALLLERHPALIAREEPATGNARGVDGSHHREAKR